MRTKTYIVHGDPQPWTHTGSNHMGKGLFTEAKLARISFDLYLRQQQGDEPLFKTPINAEVLFCLKVPDKDKKTNSYRVPDITHAQSRINELLDYLLFSMRGICFIDERLILEIKTHKCFDKDPRTEITITEVK